MNVYHSALIARKLSCRDNFLVKSAKYLRTIFSIEHPPVAASLQSTLTKIQNILSCSLHEFAVHNPKSRDVFYHGANSMVLYCLFSIQGALRKRQLIIISQSTLIESHDKYLSFIVQSHITKFDQKKVLHISFWFACLSAQYSMKQVINIFFQ